MCKSNIGQTILTFCLAVKGFNVLTPEFDNLFHGTVSLK